MSLDHDIPTHLDIEDRPALGLTAPQLLILAGGVLACVGALRQPHLPMVARAIEGLAPLALALLLVFVRPANRSLLVWGRAALLHLSSARVLTWISTRSATATPPDRCHAWPPHLRTAAPQSPADRTMAMLPGRHHGRLPATQEQSCVPWEITGDVVTFRDGRRCAVLECSGTNTALMSPEALRSLHGAYHAFLVGLPWPLQVLIWSSPVDLRRYRSAREARLAALPGALRSLESADIAFMEREARRLGLLDHRLFVVIPAPDNAGKTIPTDSLLAALRARLHLAAPTPLQSDNAVAAVLDERCARVSAELATAGVHAWRLTTDGLRGLWYHLLAPRRAHLQPLDAGHAAPAIRPIVTFADGEEDAHG